MLQECADVLGDRPDFVAEIVETCRLCHPLTELRVIRHEPDNRFLECAEAAQADFLVTGNKRHFPKQWKATKVVNARELLSTIS